LPWANMGPSRSLQRRFSGGRLGDGGGSALRRSGFVGLRSGLRGGGEGAGFGWSCAIGLSPPVSRELDGPQDNFESERRCPELKEDQQLVEATMDAPVRRTPVRDRSSSSTRASCSRARTDSA